MEYRVTFLVEADSPEDATDKVYARLSDGGEADSVDGVWAPAPESRGTVNKMVDKA